MALARMQAAMTMATMLAAGVTPSDIEAKGEIPMTVYITSPHTVMPFEMQHLWRKNAPLLEGAEVQYHNENAMEHDVKEVSALLEKETDIHGAWEAFQNLRPGAFRADMWRTMKLWANGGIYLDCDLELQVPITAWIKHANATLFLVKDCDNIKGKDGLAWAYWNAMMAAIPRNRILEHALRMMVRNVHNHYYAEELPAFRPLAITGPRALGMALESYNGSIKAMSQAAQLVVAKNEEGLDDPIVMLNNRTIVKHRRNQGLAKTYQQTSTHYDALYRLHLVYCDEGDLPCTAASQRYLAKEHGRLLRRLGNQSATNGTNGTTPEPKPEPTTTTTTTEAAAPTPVPTPTPTPTAPTPTPVPNTTVPTPSPTPTPVSTPTPAPDTTVPTPSPTPTPVSTPTPAPTPTVPTPTPAPTTVPTPTPAPTPTPTPTPTPATAVTKMKMELVLDSGSSFNESAVKTAIAAQIGVDAEKVVIKELVYKVKVTYSFTASVDEAVAKAAIAEAHGVPVENVLVTISNARRRLGRRLSVDISVVILADTSEAASYLMTKAEDVATLTQKLWNKGVSAEATLTVAPKQAVELVTEIISMDSTPVPEPDPTQLAAIGTALGATATCSDVEKTIPTTSPPSIDVDVAQKLLPVSMAFSLVLFGLIGPM